MRITDTEPSAVILCQTNYCKKIQSDAPNVPKQALAKILLTTLFWWMYNLPSNVVV